MMKAFPGDVYKFAPKSFILPGERNEFLSQLSSDGKQKKTYIVKPDSGCQGKGIALVQTLEQAKEPLEDYSKGSLENLVAHQYLNKPHLINGYTTFASMSWYFLAILYGYFCTKRVWLDSVQNNMCSQAKTILAKHVCTSQTMPLTNTMRTSPSTKMQIKRMKVASGA